MICIIDYGVGNLFSLKSSLAHLGLEAKVSADAADIRAADRLILPGVGAFGDAMAKLEATGLVPVIREEAAKKPLLGICLGMQLMCRHSEEGDADCLGIFDTDVKRFRPQCHADKVPHMGWNSLEAVAPCALLEGIEPMAEYYFVHSYYVPVNEHTVATTDYILPFSAAMQKDNFFATQFHPEKSQAVGQRLLKTFVEAA